MTRKEKDRRDAGTSRRSTETGTARESSSNSHDDCNTKGRGAQVERIASLLLYGEENALPMRHLKKMTGLNERIIRKMIQSERLTGTPILANNQTGYYLPANAGEKYRCAQSMRHRATEIYRAANAIDAASVSNGGRNE